MVGDELLETLLIQVDLLSETKVVCREMYKELLLEKMKVADGSYNVNVVMAGITSVKVKDWTRRYYTDFVDEIREIAWMAIGLVDMDM